MSSKSGVAYLGHDASGLLPHPGVRENEGEITVVVLAELYRFTPQTIRVPAGRPIRFRVTSPDVLHGFQIVGTNANLVVAPGYVSEVVSLIG